MGLVGGSVQPTAYHSLQQNQLIAKNLEQIHTFQTHPVFWSLQNRGQTTIFNRYVTPHQRAKARSNDAHASAYPIPNKLPNLLPSDSDSPSASTTRPTLLPLLRRPYDGLDRLIVEPAAPLA